MSFPFYLRRRHLPFQLRDACLELALLRLGLGPRRFGLGPGFRLGLGPRRFGLGLGLGGGDLARGLRLDPGLDKPTPRL